LDFIKEENVNNLLNKNQIEDYSLQNKIIEKARIGKGLSTEDCAILLSIENPDVLDNLFETAKELKNRIYGNRLVLFAPLYLTNHCVNNCLYCAFRRDNNEIERSTLTIDEVRKETKHLINEGHKRILLVAGEHPKESTIKRIGETVENIYSINIDGNNIRRININSAPLTLEEFKELKRFEIGTYQCFQETYHYDTYAKMHPSGPKNDYSFRLNAMDRAIEAGIDDVGIGVLFGLTDYRFEVLALMNHIKNMEYRHGIGPHTISIPRLEHASNAPITSNPPSAVSDSEFKKIIAILRLAVPYTGIILSTREKPQLRRELLHLGVSQISAGSKTSPGAYGKKESHQGNSRNEQFQLGDHRSLLEVVEDCFHLGYLPSFCTACYRTDRTGDRFMKLAKTGSIGKICSPNAIITFFEYINGFMGDRSKTDAEKFIENEMKKLPENTKKQIKNMLDRMNNGEKDIFL